MNKTTLRDVAPMPETAQTLGREIEAILQGKVSKHKMLRALNLAIGIALFNVREAESEKGKDRDGLVFNLACLIAVRKVIEGVK